jgi:hypothetical protein
MKIETFQLLGNNSVCAGERAHQGGGSWVAAPPPKPPNLEFKKVDFVGIMLSKLLHDFPFSRNPPLKSVDN